MSATQWRTSIEGIAAGGFAEFRTRYVGLDYTAVFAVAHCLEIIPGPSFLNKLRTFEREALKRLAEAGSEKQSARCDAARKEKCKAKYGAHLEWTCGQCEQNPERKHGRSK